MPLSTMQLLRDLGPAKAGSFAFVSPIIAVLVGVIAAGETVSALSVAGMAVMLIAAGACLYGDELEARFARIACIEQSTPLSAISRWYCSLVYWADSSGRRNTIFVG